MKVHQIRAEIERRLNEEPNPKDVDFRLKYTRNSRVAIIAKRCVLEQVLRIINSTLDEQPAERSQEDENALNYLHELIGFGYSEKFMDAQTAADMRDWVNKSLRPQPKQEWSKEDESNLQSCIAKIEIDMQHWDKHGKTMVDGDIKLIDWLKSLPERINLYPKQEQPEVDLEKEIDDWYNTTGIPVTADALKETARHFYGLRNRALEESAQHVYESWMGGTMDDVRRDMVDLGKVLNARKEDEK